MRIRGSISSPLDLQYRLITVSNIVIIEIKINRNPKKERPFKNLNICISASPSALASVEGVCSSMCLIIWHHYALLQIPNYFTVSHSSIQSLPLEFWKEGCLNFWTHSSAPVSKKQLFRKFLEICR